ncbi:hypothetical protein GUJ93_ZPchr0012g19765 [Zizania palustris]|uniref:Uncharacterized protein n=1 Tax=Zizania palustris TaxID=103762 RepID=A0A8J5WP98_ZIZPA|nr:hypothetical protein GUJ93_ZPchr0012g19765 [Zizania palustris]
MELSLWAMGFMEQEFKAFPIISKVQGKNKTTPVEETVDHDRTSDQAPRFSPEKGPRLSTSGTTCCSISKES